ncbi:MAG: AAA family ATPase [Nitriliruptorales bacterium]|nr:AAA family ATPase [Nitriliruptorales bacterium]
MDLVGRRTELSSVAAALDAAATGTARVVGLVGEAGIGKTRVAREAVALAEQRGFAVLTGRAPPLEMTVAYAPMLEALGGYLRALDVVARAAMTNGLPELGILFGSLIAGRPEPLADPALEQSRLFEAVARVMERIEQHAPILLLIDDAHEADAASIALLHYLCRRLDRRRVITLLTYRADADSLRPLRDLRSSLRRQGLLDEVVLAPLSRTTLAELATAQLGGPVNEALLDLVDSRAGGVPLFAETMLTGLLQAGELSLAGDCWTLTSGAAPDVPALARDVILRPLERLAAADRKVADILAIAGEPVAHDRLAALAAADDEALGAATARLVARGLVDEVVAGGVVCYGLHHPLIAEVAYSEMGEAQRRRLHAAFAAMLERDEPVDLQRLARHYRHAGPHVETDRALDVLAAAGAQALAVHANRDAVAHLSAALELQRTGGQVGRTAGVLEQLGDALERIGELGAAVGIWEDALTASSGAGDPLRAGRMHRKLAAAEWERGRLPQVRTHLGRGLESLSAHAPSRELAELRVTEVWLRAWMREFDAAAHAVAELADLAAGLDDPGVTVEALLAQSRLRSMDVQPVAALRTARRALDAAETADDPLLLWRAHDLNVTCLVWDGDHTAIRRHATAALALARDLAVPALELRSSAMLAVADFFSGDWESAFTLTATVLEQAPLVGQPRPAVHSAAIAAVLHGYRGDVATVERVLAEVQAAHGRLDHDPGVRMMLVPAEIQLALSRGDLDAATALADEALPGASGFHGWLLMAAAEAYLRADRWDDALALVPRIPDTAVSERSLTAGEALRIEGVARAGLGAPERALVCLHQAGELFSSLDLPFFAARAHLDWGRVRRGPEGAAAVRASLEVFERLGASVFADQARQVLRNLGAVPPPRRRVVSGPLSPREREVACLAAEGLTAAQIAERLVVSPHTVRTHLKRIHERLSVSSRAELTRFVVDAGWLADTPP